MRSGSAVDKKTQIDGWYVVAAVLAVSAIQQWWIERQQVETTPYSYFEKTIVWAFLLAKEFGVSRERVRQTEVRAFEKVQNAVKARFADRERSPATHYSP